LVAFLENQYFHKLKVNISRKVPFTAASKFRLVALCNRFLQCFVSDPAQETRNYKVCYGIFVCKLLVVVVSYLLASLTLEGSDLGS
jgi:hypothetical protein